VVDATDEKIERLVRSVLDAVDARLVTVREEIRALADEMEARHRQVTTAIGDVERRLARQAAAEPPAAAAVAAAAEDSRRMEQATQMLLERIEAMHQRTTMANNERFAQLTSALDELRGGSVANGPTAGGAHEPNRDLSAVSAPLLPTSPLFPAAAPVPALQHTGQVPATAPLSNDTIDLDRLGSLLSEKLGKLHLGPTEGDAR